MASWTDKTPTFNPYVAQQPVDAMVKVGMEKQKQYEAGYEKIQQSIDNVAGLDIVRDVDKQYLQSKLNTLGGKLRTVAAADFSNFQLTNSIAGMTHNIVNDEFIQDAVSSTQRYKTGLAEMRAADKAGKGSPSNTYDFQKNVSEWLNGPQEATFSSGYLPYTDYKKKALTIVKELTGDETITEDAFTIDKNGNRVLSDDIIKTIQGGITPEKVQTALKAGLSPGDYKQMEIDGKYTYANATTEELLQGISTSNRQQTSFYEQQKKGLEAALLTTNSIPQKELINDKIAQVDKALLGLTEQYQEIASMVKENPEGAKGTLQTANFMSDFSKAFSFTEFSQTREDNPAAKMAFQREKLNRDLAMSMLEYEQSERFGNINAGLKAEANRIAAMKAAKENGGDIGGGGFPSTVAKGENEEPTFKNFQVKVKTTQDTLDNKEDAFLKTMGDKNGLWLEQQRLAWLKSPNNVDPLVSDYFNNTYSEQRATDLNKMVLVNAKTEADNKFGDIYQNIPADIVPIQVNTMQGPMDITPREIVDFNQIKGGYITIRNETRRGASGPVIVPVTTFEDEKAKAELSDKQYLMYQAFRKDNSNQELTIDEKRLAQQIELVQEGVNNKYRKVLDQKAKFMDETIENALSFSQPKGYRIPTEKRLNRDVVANVLTNILAIAKDPGGVANMPDFNAKIIEAISIDPNMIGTLTVADKTDLSDAKYVLTVTGDEGRQVIPLTEEQKRNVFGRDYEVAPEISRAQPYIDAIDKMGGYSTATDDQPTNQYNSYLNANDFTQLKSFGITGNLIRSANSGLYGVRINIYDPFKEKWVENIPWPPSSLFEEAQITAALDSLTDEAVYQMLYNSAPTENDMKKLKAANNKPKP